MAHALLPPAAIATASRPPGSSVSLGTVRVISSPWPSKKPWFLPQQYIA